MQGDPSRADEPYGLGGEKYRACRQCVMDTTDPDIGFDESGVCSHCREYDRLVRSHVVVGEEGRRQLASIVEQTQQQGLGKPYDCVIGVSGGVDSSFVAHQVRQLGLRPLAVHLDNGWDSELAVKNIENLVRRLDIDLHTHVIDWEEFRDVQLAFLRAGVPDCEIPSDHAIVSAVHHAATRHRIRTVIWGYNCRTETHLPRAWSQGHYDWGYIRAVHRRFGSGKIKTFPHFSYYRSLFGYRSSQHSVHLLDYIDYDKTAAKDILQRELGWRDYGGKHHESVYTRWYQGVFLPLRFGYDKRKTHLSSLICSGQISREAALEQLERPAYDPRLQREDTEYVLKKLQLTPAECRQILTQERRSFAEFPSNRKFFSSPAFRALLRGYQFVKYGVLRRRRKSG
ncbi:MAG: N-acetyl sugar amidotransferase [Planctomycetes bacterium]|nr:N-acetyl sugar amidotransferase [Planctomycetota bacterium]